MTPPNDKPHRTTVSELAKMLAERRSASSASVTIKVAANGTPQPEVVVTPDTTADDLDRMTDMAIRSVTRIVLETAPEAKTDAELEAKRLGNAARIHAARAKKAGA